MTNQLPEFDKPPVIETVLGVQFERIPLTNALAGWYWKSQLGDQWSTVNEVQRIEDVFERFGKDREWQTPQLRLSQQPMPARLQMVREDNERMIQVQDSRFIYNWRKSEGSAYPTYKTLLPEFREYLDQFCKFVSEQKLGDIAFNQWEVIYVNHIPKDELWGTVSDWPKVFPSLGSIIHNQKVDGFAAVLQEEIGNQQGRLHTDIKYGKIKSEGHDEVISLQFTARGPINEKFDLFDGCDLAHSSIVNAFANITSEAAHKHWKRKA